MSRGNNIEFIDSKVERQELTGFSFKSIIDGSLLTVKAFVRQIPFILFGVLLTLIYIANRYHAEKMIRDLERLKTEVKDLRAEEITTDSELMNLNRPSNVQALIEKRELGLKFSEEPPKKIIKK